MLCVERTKNWLEQKAAPSTELPTHVLVLVSANGAPRPYNKKLFEKSVVQSCPRGFSYHVLLCSLNEGQQISNVTDPSLKDSSPKTLQRYVEEALSIPGQDEAGIHYYCIPCSEFLLLLQQQGFFDPFQEMRQHESKLMYA